MQGLYDEQAPPPPPPNYRTHHEIMCRINNTGKSENHMNR